MSSKRPIVGIPTQNLQSIGGVSPDVPPSWVMSHRYVHVLTSAGATPWLIPALNDDVPTIRAVYDELDGVFLPGGADIDPAAYGAARHASCDHSDPARDRIEMQLVQWAAADQKPVLGVCRGMQIISLASGGSLVQDLATLRPGSIKHDYFPFRDGRARDYLAHRVNIVEGTRLHALLGVTDYAVNSMHHQGVDRLGGGLTANAFGPDGLIEGLEGNEDQFLLGVQWHPEVLADSDERMRRLFESFVAAAREYRAMRTSLETLR